ncbi:MAG: SIR2 family protein [Fibromonadaceae bacterium]|jgi:hypothetical protein|nr:SIR2 family protein [Fibromonadaceae bacterium]
MKTLSNKVFKEIIQSGHINLLIGSGCSSSYLSTLNDIEQRMNNENECEKAKKEYFKIIIKSLAVLEEIEQIQDKDILQKTKNDYDDFLGFWNEVISKRRLHIVNKQVNIFTTNFDMFLEDSCERLEISYNDGFIGKIKPKFDVANFNIIQKYKSLQFDNISDIPTFNIIKIHGSVSWLEQDNNIIYSKGQHISNFSDYNKIAIINPNAKKHLATVLDVNYAALLRKFTLELEKENSLLLIFGFSLNDKHIKDLLYSAMESNPTLMVIYFSYENYDDINDNLTEKKYLNLYIIDKSDEGSHCNDKFSFDKQIKYMKDVISNENDEGYGKK